MPLVAHESVLCKCIHVPELEQSGVIRYRICILMSGVLLGILGISEEMLKLGRKPFKNFKERFHKISVLTKIHNRHHQVEEDGVVENEPESGGHSEIYGPRQKCPLRR